MVATSKKRKSLKSTKLRSVKGVGPSTLARFSQLMGFKRGLSVSDVLDQFPDSSSFMSAAEAQGVPLKGVKKRIDQAFSSMQQLATEIAQEQKHDEDEDVEMMVPEQELAEPLGGTDKYTGEGVSGQSEPHEAQQIINDPQLGPEAVSAAVAKALQEPIAPEQFPSTLPSFVDDQILTAQQDRYAELNTGQQPLQEATHPILPAAAFTTNDGRGVREANAAQRLPDVEQQKEREELTQVSEGELKSNKGGGSGMSQRMRQAFPKMSEQELQKLIKRQFPTLKQGLFNALSNILNLDVNGAVTNIQKAFTKPNIRRTAQYMLTLLVKTKFLEPLQQYLNVKTNAGVLKHLAADLSKDLPLMGDSAAAASESLLLGLMRRITGGREWDDPTISDQLASVAEAIPGDMYEGAQRDDENPFRITEVEHVELQSELQPFLAQASEYDVLMEDDTDILAKQNNQAEFSDYRPSNWPLGNLDNKLFIDNLVNQGIRFQEPLNMLPPLEAGGWARGPRGVQVRAAEENRSMSDSLAATTVDVRLLKQLCDRGCANWMDQDLIQTLVKTEAANEMRGVDHRGDPLFVHAAAAQGVRTSEESDPNLFNPLSNELSIPDLRLGGDAALTRELPVTSLSEYASSVRMGNEARLPRDETLVERFLVNPLSNLRNPYASMKTLNGF